jgi:apolipoprotein N-acyltransferase
LIILRRPRKQLWPLASVVVLFLLPGLPEPTAGTASAVLVQPNVPEEFEWTSETVDRMQNRLATLSLRAALSSTTDLLVWPEVPGPLYYYRDPRFRTEVTDLARATRSFFLFGTVANTGGGAPLNSAIMLRPDGSFIDRYDKMFLVPFGEFIPPLFGFVNRITQEAGDFTAGDRVVVFQAGAHRIGSFICYEAAFPHLVRRFVAQGAEVLVNVSNDGYFGRSAAREQHLELARMRAAENRRWILRATNDGITAVIDPAGRVIRRAPRYTEATLRAGYSYVSETTPYTRYGDWFVWCCLLAAAVALVVSQFPHYRRPASSAPLRVNGKADTN